MTLFHILDVASLVLPFPVQTMAHLAPDNLYGVIQNILSHAEAVVVRYSMKGREFRYAGAFVSHYMSCDKVQGSPMEAPGLMRRIKVAETHVHLWNIFVELGQDPFLKKSFVEAVSFLEVPLMVPLPDMLPQDTLALFLFYDTAGYLKKLPILADALYGLEVEEREERFMGMVHLRKMNMKVAKLNEEALCEVKIGQFPMAMSGALRIANMPPRGLEDEAGSSFWELIMGSNHFAEATFKDWMEHRDVERRAKSEVPSATKVFRRSNDAQADRVWSTLIPPHKGSEGSGWMSGQSSSHGRAVRAGSEPYVPPPRRRENAHGIPSLRTLAEVALVKEHKPYLPPHLRQGETYSVPSNLTLAELAKISESEAEYGKPKFGWYRAPETSFFPGNLLRADSPPLCGGYERDSGDLDGLDGDFDLFEDK